MGGNQNKDIMLYIKSKQQVFDLVGIDYKQVLIGYIDIE